MTGENLPCPTCSCFTGENAEGARAWMAHRCVGLAESLYRKLRRDSVCQDAVPYFLATISGMVLALAADHTSQGQEVTPEDNLRYRKRLAEIHATTHDELQKMLSRSILLVMEARSGTIN